MEWKKCYLEMSWKGTTATTDFIVPDDGENEEAYLIALQTAQDTYRDFILECFEARDDIPIGEYDIVKQNEIYEQMLKEGSYKISGLPQ